MNHTAEKVETRLPQATTITLLQIHYLDSTEEVRENGSDTSGTPHTIIIGSPLTPLTTSKDSFPPDDISLDKHDGNGEPPNDVMVIEKTSLWYLVMEPEDTSVDRAAV